MSGYLSRRVERLEQDSGAAGGLRYGVLMPSGYDKDRALNDVGLTPGPRDVVHLVTLVDLGDGGKDDKPTLSRW